MPSDNNRFHRSSSYGRGESTKRNSRDTRRNNKRGQNGSSYAQNRAPKEVFEHHQLDTPVCPMCGEIITDLPAALAEKQTGAPVHFDCVLKHLNENETLGQNEKITYIGQGRFAVAHFENPHDLRRFTIVRIIEWEERDKKYEWRSSIANLYSQVK